MSAQLDTLEQILLKMNQIWEKLCDIDEKLGGGDKPITINVPKFFEQDGTLITNGTIEAVGGGTQEDQEFTDRLTEVFRGILGAIDTYADNPDEDWEALP